MSESKGEKEFWLIKVPTFVLDDWKKKPDDMLAQLKMYTNKNKTSTTTNNNKTIKKSDSGKMKLKFQYHNSTVYDEVSASKFKLPEEAELQDRPMGGPMLVFSEDKQLVGKVTKIMDAIPPMNKNYTRLVRHRMTVSMEKAPPKVLQQFKQCDCQPCDGNGDELYTQCRHGKKHNICEDHSKKAVDLMRTQNNGLQGSMPCYVCDLKVNDMRRKITKVIKIEKTRKIGLVALGSSNSSSSNSSSSSRFVKKQKTVEKRVKNLNKSEVVNEIYKLFERASVLSLEEVYQNTDQPRSYLRDILGEICVQELVDSQRLWKLKSGI